MPIAAGTSLDVRLAAAAYSSGEGVPAAGLTAFADALGAVEWSLRWATYAGKVASTPDAQLRGVPVDGHWKVAFNIIRAEQRLCAGELLEVEVNGGREVVWFHPWIAEASAPVVERLITRGAFDRASTCSGGSSGAGSGSAPASSGGGAGELLFWGALAWGAWKALGG